MSSYPTPPPGILPPRMPVPPTGMMPPPPGMLPPFGFPPMMPPPGMGAPPGVLPPGIPPPLRPPPLMTEPPKRVANVQPTTVFIGNIGERAPDIMVRQMLARCGTVLQWKRATGANGKLQAFGFCDYDCPDAVLRCIRLMNGYEIAEKKLLVKVDQKTRELLHDHIKKMRGDNDKSMTKNARKAHQLRQQGEEEEAQLNLELVDENTLREDRIVLNSFDVILRQYAKDLQPPAPTPAEDTENNNGSTTPKDDSPASTPTTAAPGSSAPVEPSLTPKTETLASPRISEAKPDVKEREKDREKEKEKEKEKERDRDRDRDRDRGERDREREREKEREREREKERERERDRERDKEREREREREKERERERELSRAKDSSRRGTSPSSRDYYRGSSRLSPPASPIGSAPSKSTTSGAVTKSSGTSSAAVGDDDSEEARERKRLEKRLREKELAYRERLKAWEAREEKRRSEYTAERKKESARLKAIQKEARKLRQFLEDYDDRRDDQAFFKGAQLERRLKIREKEIEADTKDRAREREELEELKKRLAEKGLHEDVEAEARRIQNDENTRMKKKFEKFDDSSSTSSEDEETGEMPVGSLNENRSGSTFSSNTLLDEQPLMADEEIQRKMLSAKDFIKPNGDNDSNGLKSSQNLTDFTSEDSQQSIDASNKIKQSDYTKTIESPNIDGSGNGASSSASASPTPHSMNSPTFFPTTLTIKPISKQIIQLKPSAHHAPASLSVNQAFATDPDEDEQTASSAAKRAKLAQLAQSAEERKKQVKRLVESIPTDRDELFNYAIDWTQLDPSLMEKRIKPWINKKIVEYIGEEEQSLNDFICTKIDQRQRPERLLEEVKVILDDEAELFVKKLWRLIVYETESKRCGLSK